MELFPADCDPLYFAQQVVVRSWKEQKKSSEAQWLILFSDVAFFQIDVESPFKKDNSKKQVTSIKSIFLSEEGKRRS